MQAASVPRLFQPPESMGVGFHNGIKNADYYGKAMPMEQRRNHPLERTATDATNQFRKPGTPATKPLDAGATDANTGVSQTVGAIHYKRPILWKMQQKC